MRLPLPPLPTLAQLADARSVSANPHLYAGEPDFIARINTAWWALKVDQVARMAEADAAKAEGAA